MGRKDWATPWYEFFQWHSKYDFTIDAAADKSNTKLPRFWSEEDNGLLQDWTGERVFLNPPYDSSLYSWCAKAAEFKAELVFMLLPPSTDTKWFHDFFWDKNTHIWRPRVEGNFLSKRIKFVGGDSPRAGNLTAVFR